MLQSRFRSSANELLPRSAPLPLALLAAWRARLLPLLPVGLVVAGFVAWTISGVTLWRAIVFAALLASVAYALSLIGEATWDVGRPARATHIV